MKRVEELEDEKQTLKAQLNGAKLAQTVMLERIRSELADSMRSRLEVEISDRLTTQMRDQFNDQM